MQLILLKSINFNEEKHEVNRILKENSPKKLAYLLKLYQLKNNGIYTHRAYKKKFNLNLSVYKKMQLLFTF